MASLDEIRTMIIATKSPDDWRVIFAPLFDHSMGMVESPRPDGTEHWLDVDNHWLMGVYQPDVQLRIAYGIRTADDKDWRPEWASFPNPVVGAHYADVFWNGALIDREIVLSVDGGRAVLPDPRPFNVQKGGPMDYEQVGNTVTEWQVAVARTVHHFERSANTALNFDHYLAAAGFVVV